MEISFLLSFFILAAEIIQTFSVNLLLGECPVYFNERCNTDLIRFIFITKYNGNQIFYHLDPFNPKLPYDFNILSPLKIVIHGYGGLKVDSATRNVTKAYQDQGYNVILVDWGALSSLPCYTTAYLNTWHVGQCIGVLTVSLLALGLHPGTIHLIGFSLGAHIAGFAGANIKNVLGVSYQRITGLDPALPFFATTNNDWKLDYTDADFVDVIHTSAGSFGKIEASGHVDFYVNGGLLQPYCQNAKYPLLCSHIAAGLYFAESIRRNKTFIGVQCENMLFYIFGFCSNRRRAVMGETAHYRSRGIYFVETSNRSPLPD